MARKVQNRKELRRQHDAAEQIDPVESDALDLCRMENSMLRDVLKEKDELYQILKMGKTSTSVSKDTAVKTAPVKAVPAKKATPAKSGKKR